MTDDTDGDETVEDLLRSPETGELAGGPLEDVPAALRAEFGEYGKCPECGAAAVLPAKWDDDVPYRCFDCGQDVVHPEAITLGGTLRDATGCFVATAAYGTPVAAELHVLRRFRDEVLAAHLATRWLVGAYYRTAPPLARWIARSERRRALARRFLVAPTIPLVRRLLEDESG